MRRNRTTTRPARKAQDALFIAAEQSPRRGLLASARRRLWALLRKEAGKQTTRAVARATLRRRLTRFLGACSAGRLAAILRSAAFASAVAAALAAPGAARAQGGAIPPVELEAIARGEGGFWARGEGEPASRVGQIAAAGDVNGDGIPDLIVGGGYCFVYCQSAPSYVVFGRPGGEAVELADVLAGRGAGFAIRGRAEGDGAGANVAGAGDVNGDGLPDLLIGAPWARPEGRYRAGESYVVFGKPGGEPVELEAVARGEGGFAIRGRAAWDQAGLSVAGAGDVNGDGLPDLALAAGLAETHYPSLSGATYVIFGRPEWRLASRFRRGAVRGMETLDISDGIRLLDYLFRGGPEPPCLDAADADDSGVLELTDAVRIFGYLFLGADAPPPPGPLDCGVDPTDDGLGCAVPSAGC
jgi:hypothetical protein